MNAAAFENAVEDVAAVVHELLTNLSTTAPTKNREEETAKARARGVQRFG